MNVSNETTTQRRSALKSVLEGLFLFRGMDFGSIDEKLNITARCIRETYSAGDNVPYSESLCIVEKGKVRIESGRDGHYVILNRVGAGEIFGAAYLFTDHICTTRVIAEGECAVMVISKELITEILRCVPEAAINYIKTLSEKIDFLNRKIAAFTAGSAEARLAVYLSRDICEDDNESSLKISMTELANSLGIGRASLYRAIESLKQNDIIEYDGRRFKVINKKLLEAMVFGS